MSGEPVTQAAFEQLSKRVDANTKQQSDHENHCNDRQKANHRKMDAMRDGLESRIEKVGRENRDAVEKNTQAISSIEKAIDRNSEAVSQINGRHETWQKYRIAIISAVVAGLALLVLGDWVIMPLLHGVSQ